MVNKKKALLPIITLCTIFLLTLFISSPVKRSTTKTKSSHIHHIIHDHIRIANSACSGTLYPDLCVSTIATFPDIKCKCKSLPDIISSTINHTLAEVKKTHSESRKYENSLIRNRQLLDPRDRRAIDDCIELLDQTVTELKTSFSDVLNKKHIPDAQAFLSAAMTNQYTCLDGFADSKKQSIFRNHFKGTLSNITRHVSNSLAMVSKLPGADNPPSSSSSSNVYAMREDGFPRWMNMKDRKLLQSTSSSVKYDVIVAKDGSGNFTTISEAVDIAPNSSSTRFLIYIKAGAYYEYVEVVKKKINIMFVGDGIGKTLIKGNRSVVDGWTTFRSFTLAVVGTGFIAKGITVENYAGAIKHQAVALRSGSDFSAFYNCSFIGYQDTLYVHSLRQFYRECDIYGTVDFVFGNAAVVFQKCNLYARRPLDHQKNMFTAQGREDPFQTTGISIIESKIAPASDLIPVQSSFKSYLGRPWKEYSRTVIMRCNILDVIEPVGWHEWNGDFALSTLYYGEYLNRGAGANTTRRVTWPGFKVITNATEAAQFTAGQFIQGAEWLNATGIAYYLNLTA